MSVEKQVRKDLAETSAAITAARTLLDQGNVVDLTGMERRVEEICHTINVMPEAARGGLKALMIGLIDDLNGLAGMLEEQHKELSGQLRDSNHHQRAVSAYGEAEGKPGGGKSDK